MIELGHSVQLVQCMESMWVLHKRLMLVRIMWVNTISSHETEIRSVCLHNSMCVHAIVLRSYSVPPLAPLSLSWCINGANNLSFSSLCCLAFPPLPSNPPAPLVAPACAGQPAREDLSCFSVSLIIDRLGERRSGMAAWMLPCHCSCSWLPQQLGQKIRPIALS